MTPCQRHFSRPDQPDPSTTGARRSPTGRGLAEEWEELLQTIGVRGAGHGCGEPLSSGEMTAWLRRWAEAEPGRRVEVAEAAALVASLQNIQVRAAAWAAITGAEADRHIDLWRQVSRLVNGALALPVLGPFGMAAWIGGQSALANMVFDRAADTEGYAAYTLFELLQGVLRAGLNPREWEGLREHLVPLLGVASRK